MDSEKTGDGGIKAGEDEPKTSVHFQTTLICDNEAKRRVKPQNGHLNILALVGSQKVTYINS